MMVEALLTLRLLRYRVSCLYAVFLSSLFWPGFVFSLGGDKFVVLCQVAVNCSFCLRLCGGQFVSLVFFIYACVVLNRVFYFHLWGDKFIAVW